MINNNIKKILVIEDFLKLSENIKDLLPFRSTNILFLNED